MRMALRFAARSGFVLALAILLLIGVLSYLSNRSLVENEDAIFAARRSKPGSTSCWSRCSKRRARPAGS